MRRLRLAFALVLCGCGTGRHEFEAFDSGIPVDAGVWTAGDVLTCAHDPLPAYDVTIWDLADDFPQRDQIGSNYVVPPGAEAVWTLVNDDGGVLQGVGGGDHVGQAIRTSAAATLSGLQTVVYVDIVPVDFSIDLASVFCRMTDANPPDHWYGATLKADRMVLVEDGEEVAEVLHDGFTLGQAYRVILSCQDRSSDTLATAFLYVESGGALEELGCVHYFDDSPRGAGTVGLGLRGGTANFDGLRVWLP